MEINVILFYLFIGLLHGLFWGYVTSMIVENKGHVGTSWFFWGFFFGIYAMALALAKPDAKMDEQQNNLDAKIISSGGWKCGFCGRANDSSLETCSCGKTKPETINILCKLQSQATMQNMSEIEESVVDENDVNAKY